MRSHSIVLLAGALLALWQPHTAAASPVAPLPTSDYTARPACPAPAPGHADCLALELVPKTTEARAHTHPLGMARYRPLEAASGRSSGRAGERASGPSDRRAGRGAGGPAGGPAGPETGAYGLRPGDLQAAYFPGEAPEAPASAPQTIALVDAYNDPEAEADLRVYDEEFGLEECSAANGCFEQVNQAGERGRPPFPASEAERREALAVCESSTESTRNREAACLDVEEAEGWAVEISTDIEVAHAICQRHCHIVLVEANSDNFSALEAAEETAVKIGAEKEAVPPCKAKACDTEVSNSWGGSEPLFDSAAFEHPGTVIAASAGDSGYLNWTEAAKAKAAKQEYYVGADYPASSPHVVAVGGTRLTLSGGAWKSETVWNDDPRGGQENRGAGGGGCSARFPAKQWQREVADWSQVGCENRRAVADVAADADPYSGVAVYDSVPDFHEALVGENVEVVNTPLEWLPIGGTSVASPIIASMFALAGGSHGVEYPAQTLYEHLETGLLHPVTAGGNGECDGLYASCSGSLQPLSPRFAFDCGAGALVCNAGPGYDGPTGVGTPDGIGAFKPLSEAERKAIEARHAEEAKQNAEAEAKHRAEEEAAKAAKERETQEREAAEREASEREATKTPGEKPAGESSQHTAPTPTGASGAGSGPSTQLTASVGNSWPSAAGGAPAERRPGGTAAGAHLGGARHGAVRLAGLRLTARASSVIAHGLPTVAQVAFTFTLSAPTRVSATLSRLRRIGGQWRWASAPGSFALDAARGRDIGHLRGHGALAPGRYRLTLAPAHGSVHTLALVFR